MRFKSSTTTRNRKPVQPELVASGDDSRPVLTTIHLNAEKSEVWVTDSYMAARFPVDLEEGDTSGPIPVDALKAARKPPLKSMHTSIALNGDVQVRMCAIDGDNPSAAYLTVPRASDQYTFPNLEQLFPDNLSEFEIGLDAAKLYKLAKAMGSDSIRIRFCNNPATGDTGESFGPSNMRPITVRPMGAGDDDPTGILMPIRIS